MLLRLEYWNIYTRKTTKHSGKYSAERDNKCNNIVSILIISEKGIRLAELSLL